MGYMDVDLTNYTGVREKRADSYLLTPSTPSQSERSAAPAG